MTKKTLSGPPSYATQPPPDSGEWIIASENGEINLFDPLVPGNKIYVSYITNLDILLKSPPTIVGEQLISTSCNSTSFKGPNLYYITSGSAVSLHISAWEKFHKPVETDVASLFPKPPVSILTDPEFYRWINAKIVRTSPDEEQVNFTGLLDQLNFFFYTVPDERLLTLKDMINNGQASINIFPDGTANVRILVTDDLLRKAADDLPRHTLPIQVSPVETKIELGRKITLPTPPRGNTATVGGTPNFYTIASNWEAQDPIKSYTIRPALRVKYEWKITGPVKTDPLSNSFLIANTPAHQLLKNLTKIPGLDLDANHSILYSEYKEDQPNYVCADQRI